MAFRIECKLYTFDVATKKIKQLNTGFAQSNNNDHGFSPDGKWLAISHADKNDPSPKSYKSIIYVLPIEGGTPRRVTDEVVYQSTVNSLPYELRDKTKTKDFIRILLSNLKMEVKVSPSHFLLVRVIQTNLQQ